MATRRRRFTAEFKTRVALEALRGDRTIQAIAAKHQVHPNQVSGWKRQAVDGLQELHAKIGELTVERDALGAVQGRPS